MPDPDRLVLLQPQRSAAERFSGPCLNPILPGAPSASAGTDVGRCRGQRHALPDSFEGESAPLTCMLESRVGGNRLFRGSGLQIGMVLTDEDDQASVSICRTIAAPRRSATDCGRRFTKPCRSRPDIASQRQDVCDCRDSLAPPTFETDQIGFSDAQMAPLHDHSPIRSCLRAGEWRFSQG